MLMKSVKTCVVLIDLILTCNLDSRPLDLDFKVVLVDSKKA